MQLEVNYQLCCVGLVAFFCVCLCFFLYLQCINFVFLFLLGMCCQCDNVFFMFISFLKLQCPELLHQKILQNDPKQQRMYPTVKYCEWSDMCYFFVPKTPHWWHVYHECTRYSVFWLNPTYSTVLLPQIITRAPNVDEFTTENSPQQKHYVLLFVLHLLKTVVSKCFRKLLNLF